ncbi:ABC transporter substrate-binding protein [Eggerthellaceae bacterium zg-1084]|uniref:ABC transporter substrate-binding protein n=1 Tax=Berryella wangjianweii TaxID=2734634 RepID=UPI0015540A4B|nr:ABC transporter substrate-binding protein [Berryella wangjianweii]NPD31477.1 ABC transporter substrate-binding protein [Berryella wangjianweii]NPD33023.1 ABC transporter substrate-binding protein [Eggerthellaceae bacterium zg-997]
MQKHETSSLSRRTFIAGGAAAAAAAGLALSGCGSKPAPKSEVTPAPSGEPTGELTGACAYTSTNVNPIGNSSALMLAATWHVFEGLYDLDLHTYKTYNALAAGKPTKVSDTEYEVALRDGAKFSDGTDVTAKDVVNAFQKNMENGVYGAFLSFIDKVTAKGENAVSFKLKYAFESLLEQRLSVVKVFPASQTEDDLKTKPIGSGPWQYDTVNGDDGGTIVFKPNKNYTGEYPAGAASMSWNVMLDGTARTTALKEASVAVMENVPDANAEQITASGATVDYIQGFNQAFLMFNTLKEPFNDKRVRQAFFYAIDVKKLIANSMAGNATPVTGFLPKEHANYHEASTVYTYDPEKAKQLIEDAGATGTSFTLLVNNNWVKDLAAQIKNDLDAVGVSCTIQEQKINWSELAPSDSVLPYDVMLTPGDPTCFGNDPDLLMTWWYGDNVWTEGRTCWKKDTAGRWSELQELMQKAREAKAAAQQETWNKCFDLIAEEAPLYPLFHRKLATGYQPTLIQGFEPIATTGLVFLGAKAVKA